MQPYQAEPFGRPDVSLTPLGEEEFDWSRVIALAPQGYLELNDRVRVIHGPIASMSIDEMDWVVITLKWAARMPYPGQLGCGTWKSSPEDKTVRFPNFMLPFVVELTPEKGPRVRFAATNILYFSNVPGLDPSKVEGLYIGSTGE